MKKQLNLLLLFCSLICFSQQTLHGIVLDFDTNAPIQNVKVFVENTTLYTQTNAKGEFSIRIPDYIKKLQFYHTNYDQESYSITEVNQVFLTKTLEIPELIVLPYDMKNWETDFQTFKDNFLGKSEIARDCTIEKPKKTLRFRFDPTKQTFTVKAKNAIIIKNPKLGYIIEYYLEEFTIDYNTNRLLILGNSTFSEMKGSLRKQKKWQENRQKAYNGSLQQFIASVYSNSFQKEGFVVKEMIREANPEYPTEEEIKQYREDAKLGLVSMNDARTQQFLKRKRQPKFIDKLIDKELFNTDFCFPNNSESKQMQFENYFYVVYTQEKEETNFIYQNAFSKARKPGFQTSILKLSNQNILIYPNGYYEPSETVWVEEYWAFEKIGDMLPLDYTN